MSAAFDVTCATCGDTFQQSVKRGGGNIRHCRYCNRHSPDKQLRTQAQRLVSKAHRNMRANTKRINYLQAFCTVCGTGYTVSGTQVHQTRTCSKQCRQKQPHIIETKERLNRKRVERLKANPDLLAKERERQREDSRRRSSDPGRIAWMGSWQAKYNQREDVKERKRQRSAKNKEHLLAKRIEQMWASGASSVVPITHPCRSQERAEKSREYYINNKEKYYAAAYRRRARMYDNGEVHNMPPTSVRAAFGGFMPAEFAVFVTSNCATSTNACFAASGNQVTVKGLYESYT